jgi:acetyl esterase/lipase
MKQKKYLLLGVMAAVAIILLVIFLKGTKEPLANTNQARQTMPTSPSTPTAVSPTPTNAFTAPEAPTSTAALSLCNTAIGTTRYCNKIFSSSDISVATYAFATAANITSGAPESVWLDLYTPKNDNDSYRQAVIFGHAGGGDKADSQPANWCRDKFATRGFVCASINYRTVVGNFTEQTQKAALSDMHAAARFMRAHAQEYGIDPNKIIFMGVSAGAITAAQAAFTANNLSDPYFKDPIVNVSNSTFSSRACAAATLSGAVTDTILGFLDANDPPLYLYHGIDDPTIVYSQAKLTYDNMIALNIPSALMSFPNTGHKLGHSEEIEADLFAKLYSQVTAGTCL